jgi:hypothetical protein
MSADTLVFDMSSQSEGSPEVFVKKDFLSILDNQNQSYVGNQSVIDTSQLANSNKYMNYREAYLSIPLLMTLTGVGTTVAFAPNSTATSADYVMGLRNWYGSIIHSFTLDYNGTTIVQQTPYSGMWNTFKLMTSLSFGDILSQGSKIGFFPDTALAVKYTTNATDLDGPGTSNNNNYVVPPVVSGAFSGGVETNTGLLQRQQSWAFDPAGVIGGGQTYGDLLPTASLNLAYKSYIFNKVNGSINVNNGCVQVAITATVMLKHIHSFFERVPLLKGVFMKMTFNLNQSSVNFERGAGGVAGGFTTTTVSSPLGGVSPIMLASCVANNGSATLPNGNYIASIAVGGRVLNQSQVSATGNPTQSSPLSQSIQLIVPAYTFNPVFETAYLSSPIKKIVYTDIYQYQIVNQISAGGVFNNLITNGIANIKSVLVLPFFQTGSNGPSNLQPYQSPYEPTGSGPTSPLCLLGNFNVQVSGQNAIYNTQKYSYEQFNNQLYGENAVNGGMTDGLTSGQIGLIDFETCYNYYYVNVGRMLPVEQSVPKSVNIIGQNLSGKAINLFIFIEYGVEVSVDILSGARV